MSAEERPLEKPLTHRQLKAAQALGRGLTRGEAAEEAGVTERTVYRWLSEHPLFEIAMERYRDAHVESTLSALAASSRRAVRFLQEVMDGHVDGDNLHHRIRAASTLLRATGQLHRANDVRQIKQRMVPQEEAVRLSHEAVDNVLEAAREFIRSEDWDRFLERHNSEVKAFREKLIAYARAMYPRRP